MAILYLSFFSFKKNQMFKRKKYKKETLFLRTST